MLQGASEQVPDRGPRSHPCAFTRLLPCSLLTPTRPCAQPNGQPALVTVESRAQLAMSRSAPQVHLPSSSCWGLGYIGGKSRGEVGAAATPSHVWASFSAAGPLPQMGWAEEPRGPGPNLPGKVSLGRVGRVGEGGFPISAAYSGLWCSLLLLLLPCSLSLSRFSGGTAGTLEPLAISFPHKGQP